MCTPLSSNAKPPPLSSNAKPTPWSFPSSITITTVAISSLSCIPSPSQPSPPSRGRNFALLIFHIHPLFHPRKILDEAADRADRRRRERRLHGDRRRRPGQDEKVDGDPFLVSQHNADELDGNGHFEANDEEGEGKASPPQPAQLMHMVEILLWAMELADSSSPWTRRRWWAFRSKVEHPLDQEPTVHEVPLKIVEPPTESETTPKRKKRRTVVTTSLPRRSPCFPRRSPRLNGGHSYV